eukprot:1574884-Rhodomonas_salina.1
MVHARVRNSGHCCVNSRRCGLRSGPDGANSDARHQDLGTEEAQEAGVVDSVWDRAGDLASGAKVV